MSVIGGILALFIGLLLWGVIFLFFEKSPFGHPLTFIELLSFFIPIASVIAPRFIKCLDAKKLISGVWLAALAPLLGVTSMFVTSIIAMNVRFLNSLSEGAQATIVSFVIYAPIAFFAFRDLSKYMNEKPHEQP